MKEFSLNEQLMVDETSVNNDEDFIVASLRPEFNYICSNPTRACILHLLVRSRDSNHSMRVEEIAQRMGKRHSIIIYHLEQLFKWKVVDVVKMVKYGDGAKRSLWGLNLTYPNLVRELYSRTLKLFFTYEELEKMCSVNTNVRVK
jgi:DNA-binding transcriptional ArsR family regulator